MKYIVFLLIFLTSQSAFADDRWKDIFNEAYAELRAKRYDAAILLFEDSYRLKPRHQTLKPIIIAHANRFDFDAADMVVSRILSNHPDAIEEAGKLAQFVAVRRDAHDQALIDSKAVAAKSLLVADDQYDQLVQLREDTKDTSRWSWLGTTGAVVLAVGFGAVIHSIVIDGSVQDARIAVNDSQNVTEYRRLETEWKRLSVKQGVSTVGGIALSVIGTSLVAWDLLTADTKYQFELAPREGGFSAGVSWQF